MKVPRGGIAGGASAGEKVARGRRDAVIEIVLNENSAGAGRKIAAFHRELMDVHIIVAEHRAALAPPVPMARASPMPAKPVFKRVFITKLPTSEWYFDI